MTTLYALPEYGRLIILTVALVAVITRAVSYKLASFSHLSQPLWQRRSTLEGLLLVWLGMSAQLIAKAQMDVRESLISNQQWPLLRNVIFTLIVLYCVANIINSHRLLLLNIVLLSALTTPWVETNWTLHFAISYCISLTFFSLQGLYRCYDYYQTLKDNPSRLSIKQAIDNLEHGVLFAKDDGQIMLINHAMQQVVAKISGKVYWPAEMIDIDKVLTLPQNVYKDQTTGKVVYIKRQLLHSEKYDYYQVTTNDVSEQWRIAEQLQFKKRELERAIAELVQSTNRIMSMVQAHEYRQLEISVHNQMSRAISLLLGAIRQGRSLNKKRLITFMQGLIDNIESGNYSCSPEIEMHELVHAFKLLGVDINYDKLPSKSSKLYWIYAEIVKEAVSNAVRHGFANTVNVVYRKSAHGEQITIDNDGMTPSDNIKYGTGLTGISEKISKVGGTMAVIKQPVFRIVIHLIIKPFEGRAADD